MKKVFIIAGVVAAMAFSAKAGYLNWACADLDGFDGGIAYLVLGDDTTGVAEAIQAGTFDYGSAIASTSIDDGEIYKSKAYSGSGETSFYMVVFDTATVSDTSKFKVSGVLTKTLPSSNGAVTSDFSDSVASASWTPVAVPEPTTVALLALGLAALGLKRKVA